VFVPQFGMDLRAVYRLAEAAEESGFESFWVFDHLYTPGAPPIDTFEGWTLLTAVAGVTTTIRLGLLVGCNPLRPPALLAKMAATFDQISGGRLELGIGWGSAEDEFGRFGVPVGSRRVRSEQLDETLEILALMFTGEQFDYAGRHFQLQGAWGLPVPIQEHIPVHIGGGGRTLTMPLVAKHADWWNCVGGARVRLDELKALRGSARISAQYPVVLLREEEDRESAAALCARRMPAAGWGEPLIGTPAELIDEIGAEMDRGVELFTLRFHDRTEPATLRRFGAEVIAPLRAAH
jgi:alkanesulfonate monooxygenase SsuD/methylene tetrahydromethanopterin reductase-like flavin-dependent oxidoreductase (luciferase family)